jgi:uncharacterized protein involved in response to NO
VLLALAALWITVATGLLAKPSAATLAPAFAAALCAVRAAAMARRLWRTRRRAVAGVIAALVVLALTGAALAVAGFLTYESPPPPSAGAWTFWRC